MTHPHSELILALVAGHDIQVENPQMPGTWITVRWENAWVVSPRLLAGLPILGNYRVQRKNIASTATRHPHGALLMALVEGVTIVVEDPDEPGSWLNVFWKSAGVTSAKLLNGDLLVARYGLQRKGSNVTEVAVYNEGITNAGAVST